MWHRCLRCSQVDGPVLNDILLSKIKVSVGTLLAFTMVAVLVLILSYVPPDEVPLPSLLQAAIDSVSLRYSYSVTTEDIDVEISKSQTGVSGEKNQDFPRKGEASAEYPLIAKVSSQAIFKEHKRRKIAGWAIMLTLVLTYSASKLGIHSYFRLTLCGLGGILLLFGLAVLSSIDARHNFGHSGGFICPFVPLLPILSILINIYLLLNTGADTWMRVSVWLMIGVIVYVIYGRSHSALQHAVYVPATHVDEIYKSSAESLPTSGYTMWTVLFVIV